MKLLGQQLQFSEAIKLERSSSFARSGVENQRIGKSKRDGILKVMNITSIQEKVAGKNLVGKELENLIHSKL